MATAAATGFFMSPAKPFLKQRLASRAGATAGGRPQYKRLDTDDSVAGVGDVAMGLPSNGIDHAVKEIREEMEARQRKGMFRNDTM